MLCRYSPLPWSCRRWWLGCICGRRGLGDPPTPIVLPPKWPTGWCHQHSEGSWSFALQFVVHLEIHRGSPSSPYLLGCWTSMERTQPCWTPFLTWNHSDRVPATVTLATCFLYSLASKSIKCRGYPMSIMSPRAYHGSRTPSWSPQSTYTPWVKKNKTPNSCP